MADRSNRAGRASPHNGKACAGRPIKVPRGKDTVRSLLRRHMLEEGWQMKELAGCWGIARQSVYDLFSEDRPLAPAYVARAARMLKLDEFDTAELLLHGAREAGWAIDIRYILEDQIP